MKVCPVCGYPNPDDANYCIRCGYRFPTPSLPLYSRGEVEGLQNVKEFAKYKLIGLVAWMASLILLVIWYLSSPYPIRLTNTLSEASFSALASEFGLIAAISITFLIGVAFSLLGIYYLRLGYKKLNSVTGQFGTALAGANIIVAGLILMGISALILLLGLALNLLIAVLASAIGFVLGAIIEIIGEILAVGVGGFELSSRYMIDSIEWGGILYVVGIFVFIILAVVGLILFYSSINNAINRVKTTTRIV